MRYGLLLALAACGGDGASDTLDVKLVDTALAAVRTGDTWTPVTPNAAGEATIALDGPTTLVTVCDATFFNYYTLLVGPGMDDREPLAVDCGEITAELRLTVVAPQTTHVYVGSGVSIGGSPLVLPAGTYDLVAIDTAVTPPRFELRRDVAITADTTLTFDLAATGTPMAAARVDATGAATDETLSIHTILRTARGTNAFLAGTSTTTWVFPASALARDRQIVSVGTSSDVLGTRSASLVVDGSETVLGVALPDYLEAVTPTGSGAMWTGDSRWNDFYYGITSPDFQTLWDVRVFPAWTAAGGDIATISFADPTDLPGWQSQWNLEATTGYQWSFSAAEDTGVTSYGASRFGEL